MVQLVIEYMSGANVCLQKYTACAFLILVFIFLSLHNFTCQLRAGLVLLQNTIRIYMQVVGKNTWTYMYTPDWCKSAMGE